MLHQETGCAWGGRGGGRGWSQQAYELGRQLAALVDEKAFGTLPHALRDFFAIDDLKLGQEEQQQRRQSERVAIRVVNDLPNSHHIEIRQIRNREQNDRERKRERE